MKEQGEEREGVTSPASVTSHKRTFPPHPTAVWQPGVPPVRPVRRPCRHVRASTVDHH